MVNKFKYIPDKCNPTIDMGSAIVFADALPGLNDTVARPFGWTEYESAYRHRYIPDPCPAQRKCVDPCRTKAIRKPAPRQFVNPQATAPRSNICGLCQKARCCCPIPPPWEECKEKIVVYDPDSVRTLLVHGEVKNEHPFVLSFNDYSRLMTNAIVKSKEEKEEEIKSLERERQMKLEECRDYADEMRLIDKHKFLQTISPEAQADSDEVLCRAEKILKEDEPEVRAINRVILASKAAAIREAQLQEKELIKCEIVEEERRMDALMEQDKKYVLIKDPQEEIEREKQKKIYNMATLKAQMDEMDAYRFMNKQQKICEREEMRKIWEQQDMEELKKKHLDKEFKAKFGLELVQNQLDALERRMKEKEMDIEMDKKMMEYQAQKAKEEEEREKALALEKKMRELAIVKMMESQKKSGDAKALRDELRAKRHQEEAEREWRRQEREAILKRHKDAQQLKQDILGQIETKNQETVEQATFDKIVYDKIMNVQDGVLEQIKKDMEERRINNAQHRFALREQIHQFELRKIKERQDHYCEGIALRKDFNRRGTELRCYMDRKLEELKEFCLPDKYIKYVEKAAAEELKPDYQKPIMRK